MSFDRGDRGLISREAAQECSLRFLTPGIARILFRNSPVRGAGNQRDNGVQ